MKIKRLEPIPVWFYIVLALLIFLLTGCKHEPEFYINDKPFYSVSNCIESHFEQKWEWHYGNNLMNKSKYEYHYGLHTVSVCDKYKIDTIEIK